MKRFGGILCSSVILVAAVLGVLVEPGVVRGQAGGTITWGVPTEATGMDVQTNGQDASRQLFSFVYDQLVDFDENLNIVPGLAESWEQVDSTTYIFHLRQGVRFSNGREMTADDVVTSVARISDPELGSYLLNYGPLSGATKIDDYTVEITLTTPNGAFLEAMALEAASIIPGEEFLAGTFDPSVDMLGTGPFVLEEHLPDESWTFGRNPYYWREGLPVADRIIVKIIPEEATMLAALRDGSIDIAVIDNFDALQVLERESNVEVVVQGLTQYYVMTLNSVNPESPFLDKRVRQAINLAINKQQISDLAFGGYEQVAVPGVGSAEPCDTTAISLAEYNPDRARELIREAGAEGLRFDLFASQGPQLTIAQVIQAQLTEVGLDPQIVMPDFAESIERVYGGFSADAPGEGVASIGFNVTGASVVFGYSNWAANWMTGVSSLASSPEYRELNALSLPLNSGPERTALFQEMCELIYEGADNLPLVTKGHIIAYRSDQISPRIQSVELATDFLRYASEFTLTNPK